MNQRSLKVETVRNPTDPSAYDLVVNGSVRVEAETMEVCDAIRSSLLGHRTRHEYTEADEIVEVKK